MDRPALIFDFGNVVAHFDYRRACTHLGRYQGISGEDFLERVKGLGFSSLLQDYERGALASEQFAEMFCERINLRIPYEEFVSHWSDIFWLNEPVAELLVELKKQRYTLVLGSNTNPLHASQFRHQFRDTLAHFDDLVLSYEVGHIKPTAPFYRACARAARRPESECVFIDDLSENVEGAVAAGLRGIHFVDAASLRARLRDHGVAVA